MIFIPRHGKPVEARFCATAGLKGRYRIEAFKTWDTKGRFEVPGSRHVVADWFDNIITNTGLDLKGGNYNEVYSYCHIGTGTTAEAATDTALETWERVHDTDSETYTAQGSPPYYGSHVKVYRFNPPGSNKNYAEVGVGRVNTNTSLFSRARIKDGGGSNTTISVDADEWLDVYYECRLYPDALTVESGTTDGYAWDMLASNVTSNDTTLGWGRMVERGMGAAPGGSVSCKVYNDANTMGNVTQEPTGGTSDSLTGGTIGSYSNGTYNIDYTYSLGLSDGNFTSPDGIEFMRVYSPCGQYKFQFNPLIPKTSSKTLDVTINYAWTRASI